LNVNDGVLLDVHETETTDRLVALAYDNLRDILFKRNFKILSKFGCIAILR